VGSGKGRRIIITGGEVMVTKIRMVEIIIWNGKAYIPSNGRVPNGLFTNIEPIYQVNPTLDELVPVIQKVLFSEPKSLPELTHDEIKTQRGLIPKITGARSWKRLGQEGISYIIELTEKGFLVEMSRLDAKGRWEFDTNKRTHFPLDTDISIVIQAILDDLKTRTK
jgi:hypothetical protein